MKTVIINRFSPERAQYEEWLQDVEGEFIMVTKSDKVQRFSSFYSNTIGFPNFSLNDNVYKFISDMHKESNIDFIIATHEFDLLKAARLREHLKVTGQHGESARAFRDKVYMKQLVQNSIRIPKFRKIHDVMDLISFIEENDYPIVIKPIDGAGSVDVQIIRGQQQLLPILETGLEANLEVEEYIEGEMYHVDGIFSGSQLLLSRPSRYINGCMAFHEDKYLGSLLLQPGELFDRLNNAVESVLRALPTPDHAISFHAEFFLTNSDEIVLCEIASRVGGGDIVETIDFATGVNILRESVRAQCGASINCTPSQDRLAGWLLIPARNGVLKSIHTQPPFEWVLNCTVKPEHIGKTFDQASSSVDSVATLLVEGKDENQLQLRLNEVYEWMQNHIVWEQVSDQTLVVS
ncbi:ATP-grasp domain-containing protein [Paenibacillus sp. Marseille-Q4541]|uniref:ATP-grasp domain-containing protein n=1 Tax=Paenibacillus sp. Marseille-Q4541 TaxID=2831522 RepID=UPI001BAB9590|nr:ATP-grasp domain-containing protein [Paenibacillus sp. Marseille-Q4541]